jgi:hypothetical protein
VPRLRAERSVPDHADVPEGAIVPSQAAVEREIIRCLAGRAGRDTTELARELRRAAADLPVDPRDVVPILPDLAQRYAIALSIDRQVAPTLGYVYDLASLIRFRVGIVQESSPA